jgi:hypothetical protein
MRRQEIALSVIRGLVKRPRLADAVLRFDRWGNILRGDAWPPDYLRVVQPRDRSA